MRLKGKRAVATGPASGWAGRPPSLIERAEASGDREATLRQFVARQAMGRLGTVEEIAAGALHLASDEAAFMTGQVSVIDGEQTL